MDCCGDIISLTSKDGDEERESECWGQPLTRSITGVRVVETQDTQSATTASVELKLFYFIKLLNFHLTISQCTAMVISSIL